MMVVYVYKACMHQAWSRHHSRWEKQCAASGNRTRARCMGSISSTTILKPLSLSSGVIFSYPLISIGIFSYPLMSIFWETRFWRTGWRTKNGSRPQYLIGRFSWSFFLERLINPRPKMLPTVECWEGTVLCMARMCGTVKDFCKPIWELPVNATLY